MHATVPEYGERAFTFAATLDLHYNSAVLLNTRRGAGQDRWTCQFVPFNVTSTSRSNIVHGQANSPLHLQNERAR